jgi:hypothetical protein
VKTCLSIARCLSMAKSQRTAAAGADRLMANHRTHGGLHRVTPRGGNGWSPTCPSRRRSGIDRRQRPWSGQFARLRWFHVQPHHVRPDHNGRHEYALDQRLGVTSVTDINGNTISISPSGITGPGGVTVSNRAKYYSPPSNDGDRTLWRGLEEVSPSLCCTFNAAV